MQITNVVQAGEAANGSLVHNNSYKDKNKKYLQIQAL